MRNILLVKTSSMGDVIHCLPAATDIVRAQAEVAVDWVVEDTFAAIPSMHPQVRCVIPCAVRRWRRQPFSAATRSEVALLRQTLQAHRYDAIIDPQGLLKSAILARLACGTRYGLDWKSSREPLAPFYDRVFDVPRTLHAVERNRRLCGAALGYPIVSPPDYAIRAAPLVADWLARRPYALLLHATSHPSKLWPEDRWIDLGARMSQCGIMAVLAWGNDEEHARALRLGGAIPEACVAPRLAIDALAGLIAGARVVVGVDTGLTHLAAALAVPVIGLYCATDPRATGICATGKAANLGGVGSPPAVADVWAILGDFGIIR